MIKFAKIINQKTGLCEVGIGTNTKYYLSNGMQELDVKQSDIDNFWYLADKCPMKTDEEKEKEEREHLNKLSLTAADVERGIYKAKGMDFDDILALVASNPPEGLDIKALKIEFKANNFYRGNPYIDTVGALLGFTPAMLDKFFESGDYTALLPEETDSTETEETLSSEKEAEN